MLLTFEKIREISLNEKQEKLQKLPENFFENAKEYLKSKKGTIEEVSTRNLIEGIFLRRQKKILELCFYLYKTNKIPENLEKDEEEFYLTLVSILKNFYENFRKNSLEQAEINKGDRNIENQLVISERTKEKTTSEKENQSENNEIKGKQNINNPSKTVNKTKEEKATENHTTINNEIREEKDIEIQVENNNEETGKPNIENQLGSNTETRRGTNIEKSGEQSDINKVETKSDKTKVVFLKDVPEIISRDLEVCCFKKGEEKVLESKLVEILKQGNFCEIV